jgi:NAD(P)-dependent dehydrogenase (short-subunit alcohol dehydrogenase family)
MPSRLTGKSALVTGSTSGIGEAIAHAMAAEGARVVVTGRERVRGDEVVAAITAAGGQAAFVVGDLAGGGEAIDELSRQAVEAAGGQLDVLVNNAAYLGMNGAALYGATKAALHSLTKSWAAEFGPHGVRVNTVAPGPTLTAHNEAIGDYLAGMLSTVPSRRMSTTAEVAAAVVFLASADASNIHGATLPVDGGFTSP